MEYGKNGTGAGSGKERAYAFPDMATVRSLRAEYPAGTRVRLTKMDDEPTLPTGTCGTVRGVDDIGSLMVGWDNGSSLMVLYGVDAVEVISRPGE